MKFNRVLIGIFILVVCFLVLNRNRLIRFFHIKEKYTTPYKYYILDSPETKYTNHFDSLTDVIGDHKITNIFDSKYSFFELPMENQDLIYKAWPFDRNGIGKTPISLKNRMELTTYPKIGIFPAHTYYLNIKSNMNFQVPDILELKNSSTLNFSTIKYGFQLIKNFITSDEIKEDTFNKINLRFYKDGIETERKFDLSKNSVFRITVAQVQTKNISESAVPAESIKKETGPKLQNILVEINQDQLYNIYRLNNLRLSNIEISSTRNIDEELFEPISNFKLVQYPKELTIEDFFENQDCILTDDTDLKSNIDSIMKISKTDTKLINFIKNIHRNLRVRNIYRLWSNTGVLSDLEVYWDFFENIRDNTQNIFTKYFNNKVNVESLNLDELKLLVCIYKLFVELNKDEDENKAILDTLYKENIIPITDFDSKPLPDSDYYKLLVFVKKYQNLALPYRELQENAGSYKKLIEEYETITINLNFDSVYFSNKFIAIDNYHDLQYFVIIDIVYQPEPDIKNFTKDKIFLIIHQGSEDNIRNFKLDFESIIENIRVKKNLLPESTVQIKNIKFKNIRMENNFEDRDEIIKRFKICDHLEGTYKNNCDDHVNKFNNFVNDYLLNTDIDETKDELQLYYTFYNYTEDVVNADKNCTLFCCFHPSKTLKNKVYYYTQNELLYNPNYENLARVGFYKKNLYKDGLASCSITEGFQNITGPPTDTEAPIDIDNNTSKGPVMIKISKKVISSLENQNLCSEKFNEITKNDRVIVNDNFNINFNIDLKYDILNLITEYPLLSIKGNDTENQLNISFNSVENNLVLRHKKKSIHKLTLHNRIDREKIVKNPLTLIMKLNYGIYDPPNKKSFRPTIGSGNNNSHRQGHLQNKDGVWAHTSGFETKEPTGWISYIIKNIPEGKRIIGVVIRPRNHPTQKEYIKKFKVKILTPNGRARTYYARNNNSVFFTPDDMGNENKLLQNRLMFFDDFYDNISEVHFEFKNHSNYCNGHCSGKFGLIEYHEPMNNNVTPEVKRKSKIYDPPNDMLFRPTIGFNRNETHRQGNLAAKDGREEYGVWAFVSKPITNQSAESLQWNEYKIQNIPSEKYIVGVVIRSRKNSEGGVYQYIKKFRVIIKTHDNKAFAPKTNNKAIFVPDKKKMENIENVSMFFDNIYKNVKEVIFEFKNHNDFCFQHCSGNFGLLECAPTEPIKPNPVLLPIPDLPREPSTPRDFVQKPPVSINYKRTLEPKFSVPPRPPNPGPRPQGVIQQIYDPPNENYRPNRARLSAGVVDDRWERNESGGDGRFFTDAFHNLPVYKKNQMLQDIDSLGRSNYSHKGYINQNFWTSYFNPWVTGRNEPHYYIIKNIPPEKKISGVLIMPKLYTQFTRKPEHPQFLIAFRIEVKTWDNKNSWEMDGTKHKIFETNFSVPKKNSSIRKDMMVRRVNFSQPLTNLYEVKIWFLNTMKRQRNYCHDHCTGNFALIEDIENSNEEYQAQKQAYDNYPVEVNRLEEEHRKKLESFTRELTELEKKWTSYETHKKVWSDYESEKKRVQIIRNNNTTTNNTLLRKAETQHLSNMAAHTNLLTKIQRPHQNRKYYRPHNEEKEPTNEWYERDKYDLINIQKKTILNFNVNYKINNDSDSEINVLNIKPLENKSDRRGKNYNNLNSLPNTQIEKLESNNIIQMEDNDAMCYEEFSNMIEGFEDGDPTKGAAGAAGTETGDSLSPGPAPGPDDGSVDELESARPLTDNESILCPSGSPAPCDKSLTDLKFVEFSLPIGLLENIDTMMFKIHLKKYNDINVARLSSQYTPTREQKMKSELNIFLKRLNENINRVLVFANTQEPMAEALKDKVITAEEIINSINKEYIQTLKTYLEQKQTKLLVDTSKYQSTQTDEDKKLLEETINDLKIMLDQVEIAKTNLEIIILIVEKLVEEVQPEDEDKLEINTFIQELRNMITLYEVVKLNNNEIKRRVIDGIIDEDRREPAPAPEDGPEPAPAPEDGPEPAPAPEEFSGTIAHVTSKFLIIPHKYHIAEYISDKSGIKMRQYRINLDEFAETEHDREILISFHNKSLIYNSQDVFNTHLTKIKVINHQDGGDKQIVLEHILNLQIEDGISNNKFYPGLYLNEECNICRLGSDNREYRFNTNKKLIEPTTMKQVCNPLSATCTVEVKKTEGASNQYNILVQSPSRIIPRSKHEEEICSQKIVNPIETFTGSCDNGLLVPASGSEEIEIDSDELEGRDSIYGHPAAPAPPKNETCGLSPSITRELEMARRINAAALLEQSSLGPGGTDMSLGTGGTDMGLGPSGTDMGLGSGGTDMGLGPDGSDMGLGTDGSDMGLNASGSNSVRTPPASSDLSTEGINKELLGIIAQITRGYVDFSNRQVIQNKLDNLEVMIKKLEQGGSSNETVFLKKLLVASQMQMNNAISKLSNKPRNYLENPSLPGITQFKPSGTSNIFSPLIDIRTHDAKDEETFSEAYEKGFQEAMKQSSSNSHNSRNSGVTNFNYVDEETKINQTITDSYKSSNKQVIDVDDSVVASNFGTTANNNGDNNLVSHNSYSNRNQGEGSTTNSNRSSVTKQNNSTSTTSSNGYQRGNNTGKIGIPGYSYLEPKFFDVPQQRTPVCHQSGLPKRGNTALEPAGYLEGGHSNVMEFHSVGSILPKFKYNELTQSKKDETNRY